MKLFKLFIACYVFCCGIAQAQLTPQYAISKYGEVKYPASFSHFDYVNPDAPKQGQLKLGSLGTFDSFNGFIIKGVPVDNLSLLYDTLMVPSMDEPSAHYGLIAESIEVDPDNRFVVFNLRPQAQFHDGHSITAEDVEFSFNLLLEKGHPAYRSYYHDVKSVQVLSKQRIRFDFSNPENIELPLILSELVVLPKHYWASRDFSETTLEPPLGSGPYRIGQFEQGRYIVYERAKSYWAQDLPVNRGMYNFDNVRIDYYRDGRIALEALKAGEYDFRLENISKQWATGYDIDALHKGLLKKQAFPHQRPTGMQAFAFNTRRPLFQDKKVRHALSLLFDFEWTNQNLFYGAYNRTQSYFSNSDLAHTTTVSDAEKALLQQVGKQAEIADSVYDPQPFEMTKTNGDGQMRTLQRKALQLLREAGWQVKQNRLQHSKTGQLFEFEFLLVNPTFERVVLPYAKNLEKLGIKVNVRTVDAAQYEKRMEQFDFDMTVVLWGSSLTPGNELKLYWSSEAADVVGSRNYPGIKNAAVDQLINKVIYATSRSALITACRALDRVLLAEYYVVPHWHIKTTRVAYWDKFAFPDTLPPYDFPLFAWWVDSQKVQSMSDSGKQH